MAKPAVHEVTEEHANRFEHYLAVWREKLGMLDWRITLSKVRCKKNMAEVYKVDLEQRSATIRLGTDFGPTYEVTERTLEEAALHEILHVLLHELIETSKVEGQSEDVIRSSEHRIINLFEQLLLEGRP